MGGARRARGRQAGILIAVLAVGAIAVLTLRPGPAYVPSLPPGCIICGEYGAADAILNVLLFVPLGLGLGLMGMRSGRALLAGMVLSLLIETWQIILPGRDASLGDLITNSTGALLGAVLARRGPILVAPSQRQSRWLYAAWAVGVLIMLASVALLFSPSLPHSVWYSQWTAE